MISVTRILKSDTGHRVFGHESKCAHAHGHEYIYSITAHANALDSIGRIIDFSVIKERVGAWIDANWDHNFIVFKEDQKMIDALSLVNSGKKPFISEWNPTAENIAEYLLKTVCPLVLSGTGVTVISVVVQETSNCKAEARL